MRFHMRHTFKEISLGLELFLTAPKLFLQIFDFPDHDDCFSQDHPVQILVIGKLGVSGFMLVSHWILPCT